MSKEKDEGITFKKALKILNIEDYAEEIWHSNSHGELFHLMDYIMLAQQLKDKEDHDFRKIFVKNVEYAKENWNRPESVYQHIDKMV